MRLVLSSVNPLAVLGSSNASFAGYIENWELNFALTWRCGDPYGLAVTAANLWRQSEPLQTSEAHEKRCDESKRLCPRKWQKSRIRILRRLWQSTRRRNDRPARELSGYTLEMPP